MVFFYIDDYSDTIQRLNKQKGLKLNCIESHTSAIKFYSTHIPTV
jgi:hypothetical protein